jgi:hypothetical protein
VSCRRTRLKKVFVPYLEGDLSARQAARLERHLQACEECRIEIARLRSGDAAARTLRVPDGDAARRPPGISEILADSAEPSAGIGGWIRRQEIRLAALTTPRTVLVLAAAVLLLLVALALMNHGLLPWSRASAKFRGDVAPAGEYRPLTVPEVAKNTRPRITVEGYVRDVRLDSEERILRFKLTEKASEASPFVVCEILDPSGMIVPREGSLVRVYGVARFDAQPGREWHEINPVLNISIVKDGSVK